ADSNPRANRANVSSRTASVCDGCSEECKTTPCSRAERRAGSRRYAQGSRRNRQEAGKRVTDQERVRAERCGEKRWDAVALSIASPRPASDLGEPRFHS